MQLSVKQYETLVKLNNIAFEHKDVLNDDELKLIENANEVLIEIHDKHLIMNKRTAQYIAKKRVTNKNYARSELPTP